MKRYGLLAGPLAALLLAAGIAGLAQLVPGYSSVRQTVSEIGETDSPERVTFAVMLFAVALLLLFFARAVYDTATETGRSRLVVWFIGFMAVPPIGIAIFAFPHPLHNVFGLSELIGYLAPLVLAFTWRGAAGAETVVRFSWVVGILVWIVVAANLIPVFRPEPLWHEIRPIYGVFQRTLFAMWLVWLVGLGLLLFQRDRLAVAA